MRQKLDQYIAIVKSDPAVERGRLRRRPRNTANFNITLKPLDERKVSADQVTNRLRPKLARVPGATLFLQPVQDVQIGGRRATRSSNTPSGRQPAGSADLGADRAAEAASASRSFAT